MSGQLKLGDWVQAVNNVPDGDDGPIVAVKGDVGHVVQEETGECWAMVHFERAGWTAGVPSEDVKVLCDASGKPRSGGS